MHRWDLSFGAAFLQLPVPGIWNAERGREVDKGVSELSLSQGARGMPLSICLLSRTQEEYLSGFAKYIETRRGEPQSVNRRHLVVANGQAGS